MKLRKITRRAGMGTVAAALGVALLPALPAASALADAAKPASPRCDPAYNVKFTSKKKYTRVAERDEVFNRTRDNISRAAHFEKTTTTTWKVSGGIEGTFKALIFSEVKAHINAGVDKTSTVRAGYTDTVTIRANYKLTATQGWRMQRAQGYVYRTYSNCETSIKGYFNFYAPYSKYVSYRTTRI